MIVNVRKNCPHVLKDNLMNIEDFKKINFANLKCEKCDEKTELWICLHCGLSFCSRYINSHFIEHNNEKKEHVLCLGIMDLSIWCYECLDINNQQSNDNKGCYIESNKTNEYIKIYENFKFNEIKEKAIEEEQKKEEEKKENKEETPIKDDDDKYYKEKNELCSHILNDEISDGNNFDALKFFDQRGIIVVKKKMYNYVCICLNCMELIYSKDKIVEHYNNQKHKLFLNFKNWKLICLECSSQYDIKLVEQILKYRIICNLLNEVEIFPPSSKLILSEKEIKDIKYDKFKNKLINKKYSKILFMVGAGISTTAGIPDFRSKTGLFKQLQDKYNLSSPEEFFLKKTFLEKPQYFYEFTKLFDLSKINSTISHKFMNFFVTKNIVKYIYTQNIDGLEIKAKIPNEKLIFAHGNFYTGHCAKCNKEIDINKINEGIQKNEIYYCPACKGPCKPNVVFYGEGLPTRFFEKLQECEDVDLIIIMGTSLKVQPFASIPYLTNPKADIVVLNMESVGGFQFNKLYSNALFIEGKTDESIVKLLKDMNMFNEFKDFMKKEYNEEFKDDNDIEKLIENIENLKIN